jgi:hypothetical protein
MEGYCSTGQSPQWAVLPMEEEGDILDSKSPVNINYWISSPSTYHVHRLWKIDTSQSRFSKRQIRSLRKCLQITEFAHADVITLCSSKQWKLSAWRAILHSSFQLFFLLTWISTWVSTAVVTLENGGKLSDSDVKEKCNFLCLYPLYFFPSHQHLAARGWEKQNQDKWVSFPES